MQNFRALGAPPPNLRQLGSSPPDPKISPPLLISGYAPGSIFSEDLFFALHLICSPEKNGGRGSSPQC